MMNQLKIILEKKLKRTQENLKVLNLKINSGEASNSQKQEFIKLKSKSETLEDSIDIISGIEN